MDDAHKPTTGADLLYFLGFLLVLIVLCSGVAYLRGRADGRARLLEQLTMQRAHGAVIPIDDILGGIP